MINRTTHTRMIAVLTALLALILSACGGGGGGGGGNQPPPQDFDRRALLESYANRVALPAVRQFAIDAGTLSTTIDALATATQGGATAPAELQAAQDAWRVAMDSWQVIELLQLGPAGRPGAFVGGQGLRDEIYSWPTVNPCRVDQETVSGDFADLGFFDQELVNTRGLDAIEYLLFDEGDDNACAASVDINANGSWAALIASGELLARRSGYAAGAAGDVAEHALELRDAWEPSGGDFGGQLARAGLSGSPFRTAQDAVNDVFAALFYVELRVKDDKIAGPAGISPDCSGAVCPELRESRWADASREQILVNLSATQQVYFGGDAASGVGFDDFLRALDAGGLADRMAANLSAAIAAAEAIPGTMGSALAEDPDSVRAAHAALKLFTDDLKSQFVTVLNLRVPEEGAGDND